MGRNALPLQGTELDWYLISDKPTARCRDKPTARCRDRARTFLSHNPDKT